jgi:DNA polymerase
LQQLALDYGRDIACDGATQVVPGEGNPHARVVLIGEAPGEQEDRQGRPFVGRSGKLLDQLLNTAGLDRRDLWITNTVKCRPVSFEGAKPANRAPKPAEIKLWAECLEAELSLIKPEVIVGLGAVAGKALLGNDFKITQMRGQFYESSLVGVPVIVTWHPSYIMRQVGESYRERLAEAVSDFQAVYGRLGLGR